MALLVEFDPAPNPPDGRHVSSSEMVTYLRDAGVGVRPGHWLPPSYYVGGKGGGPGETALIALGVALPTALAVGVAKSFGEALGTDLYRQVKEAVKHIFTRPERQIQESRADISVELGTGQWLEFAIEGSQWELQLGALDQAAIEVDTPEPRAYFLLFDVEVGRWRLSSAAFQRRDELPPTLDAAR